LIIALAIVVFRTLRHHYVILKILTFNQKWAFLPSMFKVNLLLMKNKTLCVFLFLAFFYAFKLSAQCTDLSDGPSLFQLKQSLSAKQIKREGEYKANLGASQQIPELPTTPVSIMTIPKWSAESLPFFCKIEHKWAKKHRIPMKFRLGSVEYVDWLEGK